jgi:hypothetical protein
MALYYGEYLTSHENNFLNPFTAGMWPDFNSGVVYDQYTTVTYK